jgi:hypothetical protein
MGTAVLHFGERGEADRAGQGFGGTTGHADPFLTEPRGYPRGDEIADAADEGDEDGGDAVEHAIEVALHVELALDGACATVGIVAAHDEHRGRETGARNSSTPPPLGLFATRTPTARHYKPDAATTRKSCAQWAHGNTGRLAGFAPTPGICSITASDTTLSRPVAPFPRIDLPVVRAVGQFEVPQHQAVDRPREVAAGAEVLADHREILER